MAQQVKQEPQPGSVAEELDRALPAANDPGGSRAKGYSADPDPAPPVPDNDPLPLANTAGTIHVPERDDHVQPTGRDEPGEYTPNDRLMGADR